MDDTRWLTDAERQAWIRLTAVLELLPAALDSQLVRDQGLTHFDYFTLAMLSEAPDRVLRSSALAARTNATLPRLSKVINRLADNGWVTRFPCPEDRRATNVSLTEAGWEKVASAAPGHLANVRAMVIDSLTAPQIAELATICTALLARLDPSEKMLSALHIAAPKQSAR